MTILHLEWARRLRKAGSVLRRDGLSQRAAQIMAEHVTTSGSYKESMIAAGQLMAICQAAKFDVYWTEQVEKGFHREMEYLRYRASEIESERNEIQSSDGRTDEAKARAEVRQPVGRQAGEAYPDGVDLAPPNLPQIGNQVGVGSERSSPSDPIDLPEFLPGVAP